MKINWHRLVLGLIYCSIAVGTAICLRDKVFYVSANLDDNFFRFLWAVLCSCFGFGVLTLKNIDNKSKPFPTYYFYYPILLIVISSLVFAVLHLFAKTSSSYVYYYLSFSLCFILGYMVDAFWGIIYAVLDYLKKK